MTDEQVKAVAKAVSDALNLTLTPKGRDTVGRAAIAAYEASQWRPIETAPRDGEAVLVVATVREVPFVCQAWFDEDYDGWWKANTDWTGKYDAQVFNPTHWRPLPTPPGRS